MKTPLAALLLGTCLTAGPLTLASTTAQAASPAEDTLQVDDARTLSFAKAIGRIEVSRENVIRVTAPTTRSLRITGLEEGQAQLTVFGTDGSVMREELVRVDQRTADGTTPTGLSGPLRKGEKIVAVDVQFAAVSDTTLKELGFNFSKLTGGLQGAIASPSTFNGATLGSSVIGSSAITSSNNLVTSSSTPFSDAFNLILGSKSINGVISALSSTGLSQLLAQPTLMVRSGEKASFLAGGEFPVPVPQSSGGTGTTLTIQYKEFGIRLAVTPWVLSADHIVLKLAPEVSELDYGNGVQLSGYTIPGIRRRSAETTVELGSGQSFVIAGLNYSNSSVTKGKVPFLGDIPILGAFFKQQQNSKERQELIIVATPRLVDPSAAPAPQLKTAADMVDPSVGQMILGNDGVDKASADFGVVRR